MESSFLKYICYGCSQAPCLVTVWWAVKCPYVPWENYALLTLGSHNTIMKEICFVLLRVCQKMSKLNLIIFLTPQTNLPEMMLWEKSCVRCVAALQH